MKNQSNQVKERPIIFSGDMVKTILDGKSTLYKTPAIAFERLWDTLNAKKGYPWSSNPWVWVVEFKVVEVAIHDKH